MLFGSQTMATFRLALWDLACFSEGVGDTVLPSADTYTGTVLNHAILVATVRRLILSQFLKPPSSCPNTADDLRVCADCITNANTFHGSGCKYVVFLALLQTGGNSLVT